MSIPREIVRKNLHIISDLRAELFVMSRDYEEYASWWTSRKLIAPIPDALSTTGIMVTKGGLHRAASFVFLTNSPSCLIAWTAVKPTLPQAEQDAALDCLIRAHDNFAEAKGHRFCWFPSANPKIIARYEKQGYTKVDDGGITFIIKALNPV